MSRSASRLKNILNQRSNLWADSESDSSSSHADENDPSTSCCLICSVLPNLSNINTCEKHLNLITKPIQPTQVVYMMQPAINNCHCRTKSKRRCRSSSSSSSSTEIEHQRKKRVITIQLSDSSSNNDNTNNSEGELFFSPNVKSQVNTTEYPEAPLSPSLPPSATINNANQQYNELLLTTCLRQNSFDVEPPIECIPNIVAVESSVPDISLSQIIHVKDENEFGDQIDTINMAEATEQMLNHMINFQPVIRLKRVRLDDDIEI